MRLALALFLLLSVVGAARADNKAIAPGMEAMVVRTIQGDLAKLGYYHGPVDGLPGPGTEQAIRAWQHATGRKVDGVPTPAMVNDLRYGAKTPPADHRAGTPPPPAAPPPAAPAAAVNPGVDGALAVAQKLLAIEGYYKGPVDGRGGPQTVDAIKQWQEDHRMVRTGQVDAALLMSLAKSPTALPEPPEAPPAKPGAAKAKP